MPDMKLLTRDDILAVDDRPVEEVEVPEWGGVVLVMGVTGKERDEYFASMASMRGKGQAVMNTENATAKLVARCIVAEDRKPLFSQQDVAALGEKSGAALDRVFTVAQRLSGLSDKDMEELGKASTLTLNGGSTSA